MPASRERITLVAIPISHYCEKARWGLERAGIDYEEERHLQGFHHFYARRRGGDFTTPVLVFPDDRASIRQSSKILEWIDTQVPDELKLYPNDIAPRVRATEHWFDATLGPDGRGWLYKEILDDGELIEEYGLTGIPNLERRAYKAVFTIFKPYLAARIRVQGTRAESASVFDIYDAVAERIADGRPYLFGDRFTAADLTFAALSAPVVLPRKYGIELPPFERMPASLQQAIDEFRAHPAGQFAERLIDRHRPPPGWMAQSFEESGVQDPSSLAF